MYLSEYTHLLHNDMKVTHKSWPECAESICDLNQAACGFVCACVVFGYSSALDSVRSARVRMAYVTFVSTQTTRARTHTKRPRTQSHSHVGTSLSSKSSPSEVRVRDENS